ncbi:hypothetical protein DLI67_21550 [Acinetobacter baumannii]|nr:hypothetical protein DLI67_21550 [Acinetobacter baumannii]
MIFQKIKNKCSLLLPCDDLYNGELLLDMCLKDHGIVFLPELLQSLTTKKVNYRMFGRLHSQPLHLYVTWPNRKILSKKVKLFIDFLTRQIVPIK